MLQLRFQSEGEVLGPSKRGNNKVLTFNIMESVHVATSTTARKVLISACLSTDFILRWLAESTPIVVPKMHELVTATDDEGGLGHCQSRRHHLMVFIVLVV